MASTFILLDLKLSVIELGIIILQAQVLISEIERQDIILVFSPLQSAAVQQSIKKMK